MIAKIRAKEFVKVNTTCSVMTILMCYVTAQVKGHVERWIPMISDCFVYAPESYMSRYGVITFINYGTCVSNVIIAKVVEDGSTYGRILEVLAVMSSLSFGMVGAVSEVENETVHNIFALSGFIMYGIYIMIINVRIEKWIGKTELMYNALVMLRCVTMYGELESYKPMVEWMVSLMYAYHMYKYGDKLGKYTIGIEEEHKEKEMDISKELMAECH